MMNLGKYDYNPEGVRIKKTLSDGTYRTYQVDGTKIVSEYISSESTHLVYLFDASGSAIGFRVIKEDTSGKFTQMGEYYYRKNLQGDILAVYNKDGQLQVSYTYDAWGNFTATYERGYNSVAAMQSLRYRGYYYDGETGLYYLNSRYYNPKWGRFINADGYVSTGQGILSNNMFAYCGNNPVNRVDPSGQFWITALIVTAVVAVCTVAFSGCSTQPTPEVGAASPYSPSNSMDYNCYAYALGEDQWKYVGGSPDAVKNYSVDNVAEMVLIDAQKDGRAMRIIDSYDSPIESNEYRIALRTGKADYHFMVQHNDGSWSHKPGYCSTRLINGANPSVISWDAPQVDAFLLYNFGIVKEIGSVHNYYDSRTIYFAVSK